jgi:hypothetical protein
MVESLLPLFLIAVALLWILDFLGILEIGAVFVWLFVGLVGGTIKLAGYLIRRMIASSKPQS